MSKQPYSDDVDLSYNSLPVCPYCGEEYEEWWDGSGLMNDGDYDEFDCSDCGRTYRVRMCLEPTFTTEKIMDDIDD